MRTFTAFFVTLITTLFSLNAFAEDVSFKAADGLEINGELTKGTSSTAILLFHQAGSSRGEYQTIAPRLNTLGYTTLTIDQRSGGSFGGLKNETAARAKAQGLKTNFLDARPDLEAAIAYAGALSGVSKVVVWGSSYSSSLVLVIAGEKSAKVDGVLSFSPGEYLRGVSVQGAAKGISVPTFITSAKSEAGQWAAIHGAIPANVDAVAFKPNGGGAHGSSALIGARSSNPEEYWAAVESFLKANF